MTAIFFPFLYFYRYEIHYNAMHKNVCSECHRSFPTSHLLEIHVLEWHDNMFQLLATKQDMVRTSFSIESSKSLALLVFTPSEREAKTISLDGYMLIFIIVYYSHQVMTTIKEKHSRMLWLRLVWIDISFHYSTSVW